MPAIAPGSAAIHRFFRVTPPRDGAAAFRIVPAASFPKPDLDTEAPDFLDSGKFLTVYRRTGVVTRLAF
jgi:hypothetical protein